jgi:hypothetical protein
MLSMNVSALRIIGVGEIEEIPGCDGYTVLSVIWYPDNIMVPRQHKISLSEER